jgi:hypothetical protein
LKEFKGVCEFVLLAFEGCALYGNGKVFLFFGFDYESCKFLLGYYNVFFITWWEFKGVSVFDGEEFIFVWGVAGDGE